MSFSTYDALFKETPGGYLFRAPNPWLVGAGKHYLTDQAQRAEILELGRVRRPVLRALVFALTIGACPGGSTLLIYLLSGHAEPDGGDIGVIAILTFISLVASLLIVTRARFRRLHPILMGLPRSDQRLTLRDIQAAQVKATPLKTLLVLGTILTLSAVIQAISLALIIGIDVGARRHLTVGSSQLLLFCLMLLQGGLAALSFKRAISRYVQGKPNRPA